jgi:ABC-type multidrug transport system fused ATPase/permease subunit
VYLWDKGIFTIGELIMVTALMISIQSTLVYIGMNMNGFIRRYGEVEEGLVDIVLPHEIVDTKEAKKINVTTGEIVFSHVNFNYEDNNVFSNFNLAIDSGERVGLVGTSGAGKTTLVSLLLRQHELNSGSITIDGQDISLVTQDSVRENIAVVPQEPLLFHRSIRDNIAYGKSNAIKGEIISVAKKAQADEFIKVLPSGYDTFVGERGVKLSGGQKQRVALARAMLKNAPILVLDEATSALDSESEVAIQKALHELMKGKTVIAIAHRLSTLREMDRIIVIDLGKIVESGTHDELVKTGGLYERLWKHQAGGFLGE